MLLSFTTFVSLLAASTTLVSGASVKRQTGDNGSCDRLEALCYDHANVNFQTVWGVEACVFAGVCYERNGANLDDFLNYLWQRTGHTGNAPPSVSLPRVTQSVFNTISNNGPVITQQDYVNGYNNTLKPGGPFPNPAVVISDYHRVASWTNFCSGQGIPYKNFADYFQYSATVPANFCP